MQTIQQQRAKYALEQVKAAIDRKVDQKEYRANISKIKKILNGHFHKLIFKSNYSNTKNILINTTVNLKNNSFPRINLNRKILPNTNKLD